MNEQWTQAQKRAVQYWFIDGWAEIAAGLVSMLLAGMFWWWNALMTGPWSLLAVMGALLAVSVGLRLLMHRVKARTTYPRTGYAAPSSGVQKKSSLLLIIGFTVVLLAVNMYLSVSGPQAMVWSPAAAALAFAFVFGWTAYATGLRRLVIPAVVAILVGASMPLLGFDYYHGVGLLAAVVGLVLLLMGWRTRRDYERQHPAPTGAEIDG